MKGHRYSVVVDCPLVLADELDHAVHFVVVAEHLHFVEVYFDNHASKDQNHSVEIFRFVVYLHLDESVLHPKHLFVEVVMVFVLDLDFLVAETGPQPTDFVEFLFAEFDLHS